MGWPKASRRSELEASLIWEKRVSEGRSEAIETNTPKAKETSPRRTSATRMARSRKSFSRGFGAGVVSKGRSSLIGSVRTPPGVGRVRLRAGGAAVGQARSDLSEEGESLALAPACRTR